MSPASLITLVNGFFILALALLSYFGLLEIPLIFSYQTHKILHLIGVMLFFGNMVVGPVWLLLSIQTRQPETMRYAARLLQLTDVWITVPAIDLALLNGLAMAQQWGGVANSLWLSQSVLLLVVMWALSLPTLYFQEKMVHLMNAGVSEGAAFRRVLLGWGIVGTIVTIPPSLVMYLMVFKGW